MLQTFVELNLFRVFLLKFAGSVEGFFSWNALWNRTDFYVFKTDFRNSLLLSAFFYLEDRKFVFGFENKLTYGVDTIFLRTPQVLSSNIFQNWNSMTFRKSIFASESVPAIAYCWLLLYRRPLDLEEPTASSWAAIKNYLKINFWLQQLLSYSEYLCRLVAD